MKSLGKPLSIVLGLMAAAVLFHFLVSPFYENEIDVYAVWDEINWVMALGILIALALTYVRKRDVDPDADANTLIWVNVAFYAAVALAILFFWNWFDSLTAGEGGQSSTRGIFWVVVNTTFVILLGNLSVRLWKDASSE